MAGLERKVLGLILLGGLALAACERRPLPGQYVYVSQTPVHAMLTLYEDGQYELCTHGCGRGKWKAWMGHNPPDRMHLSGPSMRAFSDRVGVFDNLEQGQDGAQWSVATAAYGLSGTAIYLDAGLSGAMFRSVHPWEHWKPDGRPAPAQ